MEKLYTLANYLVQKGKGILAADESYETIGKRFESIGIENSEENRRKYRELLFTAPRMEEYISGVILFEETLAQSTSDGRSFSEVLKEKKVAVGIKVDQGKVPLESSPGEYVTVGLDDLPERLERYKAAGAMFAKWRGVIQIGEEYPTDEDIRVDAERLADYAKMCQDAGVLPIVEPEVLMDGNHSIERCYEVTELVLSYVFDFLDKKFVDLEAILLKPNMVHPGKNSAQMVDANKIAEMTLDCFRKHVPGEVPGIVFLSGGQSEDEAVQNLQAINALAGDHTWKLSYSFGRALQNSALNTWAGMDANIAAAQAAFLQQAERVSKASLGVLE